MLVLSRKDQERIRIGDDIVITVVRATNGRVQIGVEAPSDVPIVREKAKDLPANATETSST